jgi:hypothetical protein
MNFGGALDLQREVKLWSRIDTIHRSCWGFWARRARISVDMLELGSYLVGTEERFWAVFCRSGQGGQRRTNGLLELGYGISNFSIVFNEL